MNGKSICTVTMEDTKVVTNTGQGRGTVIGVRLVSIHLLKLF